MSAVRWQELAGQLVDLKPAGLPGATVEEAGYLFLDWLGCSIAGTCEWDSFTPSGLLNLEQVGGTGPEATLIGVNRRTSVCHAALVNGIVGHALGLVDTVGPAAMPVSAGVIPASLSLAEKYGRSGPDFLTAVVAGYEVAEYLDRHRSESACTDCSNRQIESCAAAAAAARVLGLEASATASALAMAWTQSVAPPALNGVLSACAAAHLPTRSPTAQHDTDARHGKPLQPSAGPSLSWGAPGRRYVRLHAADVNTHAAIDAALELKRTYRLHPEDIEAIEVHVSPQAIRDASRDRVDTLQELRRSIPYCIALTFLRGRVGLGELSMRNLLKAPVGWLMSNTTVQSDERPIEGLSSRSAARVVVRTRYGTSCEHTVTHPRGSPGNPARPEDIEAKFRHLTASCLSDESASTLTRRVLGLEALSDLGELFSGIRFGTARVPPAGHHAGSA